LPHSIAHNPLATSPPSPQPIAPSHPSAPQTVHTSPHLLAPGSWSLARCSVSPLFPESSCQTCVPSPQTAAASPPCSTSPDQPYKFRQSAAESIARMPPGQNAAPQTTPNFHPPRHAAPAYTTPRPS